MKKKVVHVIAGLSTGGAEMMLYKLLSRRDRYDESVICLRDNLDTAIARKILDLGVDVRPFRFSKTALNVGALLALRSAIKSIDPDVIHAWMYHGNVASILLRRWAPRAKLIWNVRHSLHDIKHERALIRGSIKVNRHYSQQPDAIVYNSKTSSEQHARFGFSSAQSVILPNGFDCDVFAPNARLRQDIRRAFQLENDTLALGVVARYHDMKGHDVCLQAVKIAVEKGVNVRLFLIGAGLTEDNAALLGQIRRFGIEDRVALLGERDNLHKINRLFDVLVSSSQWGEAFSNSIGEAMASGVPCVVTDVGDSSWIVADTGVVVAPGDPSALAEGILKMARLPVDERERRGLAARQRVLHHFSIQKVAQLYDDLYTKLTEQA